MKGNQQLTSATDALQQLVSLGQQQYNTVYPWEQQLGSQSSQTLAGVDTPLMQAFRNPVIAQTQQDVATAQNQGLGSQANPNALWQSVYGQGQQQAGLAGLQAIPMAANIQQNLVSGGLNAGLGAIGTGGQGLGNIGEYLNSMFTQDLGALGQGAGSFFGAKAGMSGMQGLMGGFNPSSQYTWNGTLPGTVPGGAPISGPDTGGPSLPPTG